MKLIVEFDSMDACNKGISGSDLNVLFKSSLLPYVLLNASKKSDLDGLNGVINISKPDEGHYLDGEYLSTVAFTPAVHKRLLANRGLVGWGDTKVVIIDSGVNEAEVTVVDTKDFTGTGIRDFIGHGTRVSKIVKHFARGANLYVAKVGNNPPMGDNVLMALEWAAEVGADLVNISIGFECKPNKERCLLCRLLNKISSMGIIVVVAAGNDGEKGEGFIACPGCAEKAITVGAIDENENLAYYSSKGTPGQNKPNILAPGAVYIDGALDSGTSFSAPIITGILASSISKTNSNDVIKKLYQTAKDLGLPRHHQGNGLLNLDQFVTEVCDEKINSGTQ